VNIILDAIECVGASMELMRVSTEKQISHNQWLYLGGVEYLFIWEL